MRVSRPMSFCLTLSFSLLLAGTAAAQQPASFARSEAALAAIEKGLSQIERGRRITEQLDPEASLDAYYKALRQDYEVTMQAITEDARRAEEAARTGRKVAGAGPGQKLGAWEKQVGALRGRTEKIVNRLTQINLGLRDASIMIAPELLKKMPGDEVRELRQWMTPEAIRKYQALDRSLFTEGAAQASPLPPPAVTASMTRPGQCRGCGAFLRSRQQERAGSLLADLGDLLVRDAEAALAVTCVTTCTASPPACLPCVVAAVGATSFLATQLDAAFDKCDDRRTRLGRTICKIGVVLAFLTVIG